MAPLMPNFSELSPLLLGCLVLVVSVAMHMWPKAVHHRA
jgi:hypothetical protein